jgi:hypothetical protein
MKKIRFVISGMAVVAALSAGCAFEQHSDVLAPSLPSGGSSAPSYIGTWISQATDLPSFASCSVLEWEITAQSSNSLSGTFSATCSGVLVEGRASGQLNGKSVPLSVAGTASLPGNPSCSFSLSGTGTIDGNTLTIPYSGTTCLGPVRGTEVLQKRTPPPPPAPPPPPPPAAPVPSPPASLPAVTRSGGPPRFPVFSVFHNRVLGLGFARRRCSAAELGLVGGVWLLCDLVFLATPAMRKRWRRSGIISPSLFRSPMAIYSDVNGEAGENSLGVEGRRIVVFVR